MDSVWLIATVAKVLLAVGIIFGPVPLMTWVERRGSAIIQLRRGPNRVGLFGFRLLGLGQPLADGIKFLFKEDIIPPFVHRTTYVLAPLVAVAAAIMAFAVIPFGSSVTVAGQKIPLVVADFDVGVLVLLAASGLGVYGIIMAGWSSNNKYSQLGGLRSSSQMISYELALGLAVVAVLVFAGTLRPTKIVELQSQTGIWNVVRMPLGALILFIAGFAETNRAPFDLPEAESELVAGYHTEYSSMKFSMFPMAEYMNMFTSSALLVTLYLGGYAVPEFIKGPLHLGGNVLAGAELVVFMTKVFFFQWVFVWVRWTLPRFRFDQLLNLGWKVLIPLALLNVVWAGLLTVWVGVK